MEYIKLLRDSQGDATCISRYISHRRSQEFALEGALFSGVALLTHEWPLYKPSEKGSGQK